MSGKPNPAHVVVATVVERDGRYLVVEERIGDRLVINQPAGHWDEGETLFEAACRETLEETGWTARLDAFLGVYEYEPSDLGYGFLRFAFLATAISHDAARPLDAGIERAVWRTREELAAEPERLRSPMVLRCIDDARHGRRFPLDLVQHLT